MDGALRQIRGCLIQPEGLVVAYANTGRLIQPEGLVEAYALCVAPPATKKEREERLFRLGVYKVTYRERGTTSSKVDPKGLPLLLLKTPQRLTRRHDDRPTVETRLEEGIPYNSDESADGEGKIAVFLPLPAVSHPYPTYSARGPNKFRAHSL